LLVGIAGLAALLLLIFAVLLALPYLTNLETIRTQVAAGASDALQSQVTLKRLSLRAIPRPGVQIEGLGIAERNGTPLATVDRLIVEVSWEPLIRQQLLINRIVLAQPKITLTRNADGSLILPVPVGAPTSPAPSAPSGGGLPPLALALEEARIENGEVVILDRGRTGDPPFVRVAGLDAVLYKVSLAPAPAAGTTKDSGVLPGLAAQGRLEVREGQFQNVKMEDFRAAFTLRNGLARMDGIAVKLLGGTGSGTALADFSKEVPQYETNLTLESLQMDRLYAAMGRLPGLISGAISAQEAITARGLTPDDFTRSLTGSVRFAIKDGSIRKMDALGKILSVLNVRRMLSGKPPDIAREGVPFDRITGTLQFKNGLMTTDDLKLQSPVLNAVVKGTFNLPDNQMKLVVSALGTDFDVVGVAGNPTVSSRAAKGLQEGVGGLLEKGLGLFR
jgi:uncharacterized protein involved in outer membrane biogenesis